MFDKMACNLHVTRNKNSEKKLFSFDLLAAVPGVARGILETLENLFFIFWRKKIPILKETKSNF